MKRILLSLIFYSLALPLWAAPVQSDIEQLIKRVDPATHLGALVVDLNTGETLYSRNATEAFIPASNMKLFSDAAALLALGPNYRFQTELSTNAHHLENGVLDGSIYLYLPGDPSLTSDDLNLLLTELKAWGITRIKGNIILISSRRGINPYAPGWTKKDLTYSYGAPLAPLVLDENRLIVTVNPAARAGEHAVIELRPSNNGVKLHNEVTTEAKGKNCGISYLMDAKNQLTVKGCIGIGSIMIDIGPIMIIISLLNPGESLLNCSFQILHLRLTVTTRVVPIWHFHPVPSSTSRSLQFLYQLNDIAASTIRLRFLFFCQI